jgi:hypothetical protein
MGSASARAGLGDEGRGKAVASARGPVVAAIDVRLARRTSVAGSSRKKLFFLLLV